MVANLRAINTWLVHHWLDQYPQKNAMVSDYYNALYGARVSCAAFILRPLNLN